MLRRRLGFGIPAHGDAASSDLVVAYIRWTWSRAALHRGWWLVTSVYLVVDAQLTPSQLVLVGVAQGAVALVFEVPAGVLADTVSRKWSLVVSHALMGTAMVATGLVTGFGLLLATQMLWGLAWTFASGADVALITDELDDDLDDLGRASAVLMRSGRAQLTGAAAGIMGLGALGSVAGRSTAMVLAGAAMLLLGLYVAARFREERFVPARSRRWSASWSILARGTTLVRRNRALLVMFAATFLVNGAAVSGRLHALRLVDLGLPADPVAWLTVIALLTLLAGTVVFRLAEPHVGDSRAALRGYALACAAGALGLVVLAAAPEDVSASAGVLVVGTAVPLTRTLGTIWVNRQTSGDVRATVHSFLAQAEYLGAIVCGSGIAFVARPAGLSAALLACAVLFALALLLVRRVPAASET